MKEGSVWIIVKKRAFALLLTLLIGILIGGFLNNLTIGQKLKNGNPIVVSNEIYYGTTSEDIQYYAFLEIMMGGDEF